MHNGDGRPSTVKKGHMIFLSEDGRDKKIIIYSESALLSMFLEDIRRPVLLSQLHLLFCGHVCLSVHPIDHS